MQVLSAQEISKTPWEESFHRIFPFDFQIDDAEDAEERLLTRDEIDNLEADVEIVWDKEDADFALALIRYTLEHEAESALLIERFSKNWKLERIASIDRVVMKIAVAELRCFSDIPPKVTINEAIEIVKKFSTDKSGTFVNGILDAVLEELQSTGNINKSGRGLLDSSQPIKAQPQSQQNDPADSTEEPRKYL